MAPLRLLSLAAASLLVIGLAEANADGEPKNTSKHVDCLSEMNAPRTLVGLTAFTAETDESKKLPIQEKTKSSDDGYVNQICEAITKGMRPSDPKTVSSQRDGTFVYAPQSTEKSDCSSAVNYWKASGSKFGKSLPPVYSSDSEAPYDSAEARSFVALFNPGQNPTVDCAYITCTVTTTTTIQPTSKPSGGGSENQGGSG